MSPIEHYFENLLDIGSDIKGEPNKNALSKEVQEAIEICADYIKYTQFLTKNCIACKYDEEDNGEHCKKCLAGDNQFEFDKEFVQSTTKNDLGVDCISRADAIRAMQNKAEKLTNEDTINGLCGAVAILFDLPSVISQEPILDKIRAEIANHCGVNTDYCDSCRFCTDSIEIREILTIIDKYKAESEG